MWAWKMGWFTIMYSYGQVMLLNFTIPKYIPKIHIRNLYLTAKVE